MYTTHTVSTQRDRLCKVPAQHHSRGKVAAESGVVSVLEATGRYPAVVPVDSIQTSSSYRGGITHWGHMPARVQYEICWGAEATLGLGAHSAQGCCISHAVFSLLYRMCLRTPHSPGAHL